MKYCYAFFKEMINLQLMSLARPGYCCTKIYTIYRQNKPFKAASTSLNWTKLFLKKGYNILIVPI